MGIEVMGKVKWKVVCGDTLEVLKTLPDQSIQCCVTSPPYWGLRDYGVDGQLGLEKTPEEYVEKMVQVFRGVKRVLRNDGSLWLNLGDSYFGSNCGYGDYRGNKSKISIPEIYGSTKKPQAKLGKPKDLCGIPWRVAFALQADGWYLRSDIIWHKPNVMPESVKDRPTKGHEYVFLLTKGPKYFYDSEAIKEPYTKPMNRWGGDNMKATGKSKWAEGTGQNVYRDRNMRPDPNGRNKRTVWTIPTTPYGEAHFATFPEALVLPMIKAGTSMMGCCNHCGSPFVLTIEKGEIAERKQRTGTLNVVPGRDKISRLNSVDMESIPKIITVWTPSCKCDNFYPSPCVVLDPFCGSGTVGMVAVKLGRNFFGIDLNPQYVEMAKGRITNGR